MTAQNNMRSLELCFPSSEMWTAIILFFNLCWFTDSS